MQNNRSDPSAVPGDPKLTDQTLLKEPDLQRCIEALQCIICDLLIENERLRQHLQTWERRLMERSLRQSNGNKAEAARLLGIHRRLLYEKLRSEAS
jgi:DNA-binding NtrC family response regulator